MSKLSEQDLLDLEDAQRPPRALPQTSILRANDIELALLGYSVQLHKSNEMLTAEVAERKRAERALKESQQQLRLWGRHTERIVEDERKRIARELHDQLGQNLMALRIDVLMMQAAAGEADPKVGTTVHSALDNIDSMIKNVRAIINTLRPALLDLGLVATIEWQIKEFERRSGIRCNLESDRSEFVLDEARALAVLRILQESLNNVVRHARANRVDIQLRGDASRLYLRVADDGVGDFPGCRRKANAFGLLGIQERVNAFGGEFKIETGKGKGLALSIALPLPADDG